MTTAVMNEPIADASPLVNGDTAGVFYLSSILMGGAAAVIRWRLLGSGEAHESMLRMLFTADLISVAWNVAVTLLFFELFKSVNKRLSLFAASVGLVRCAIAVLACLFDAAALSALRSVQYFNIPAVKQTLPILALMSLKLRTQAYSISLVVLGFYCLMIACLILRSSFLPRFVGVLMAIAGLGWLIFSAGIAAPALVAEGTLTALVVLIGVTINDRRRTGVAQ